MQALNEAKNVLAFILGGGKGSRLWPLTQPRAKPAVPFANYRVIDFVLSNMYHSGIRKILVLTQYKSYSLHKHLKYGWYSLFGNSKYEFIMTLPASQGYGDGWYKGTADAITQNLRFIEEENPDIVNVFGGDHVFFMNVSQMNQYLLDKNCDLAIAAIPVPVSLAAKTYGVLVIDQDWNLTSFEEKPENPTPLPNNPNYCLASMGNYAFKPHVLLEELALDLEKETTMDKELVKQYPDKFSTHDFGYDVIPSMLRHEKKVCVYNFEENFVPGMAQHYWRDIGNIREYYIASMELLEQQARINIYNQEWPVLTYIETQEPVMVKRSSLENVLLANGVVVNNSELERSILGYGVNVENSQVKSSILLGYNIVKNAVIKNTIIDRGVEIPEGLTLGLDPEQDRSLGLLVFEYESLDHAITVVPKGFKF
ncbi:glucose-1-phosphate adenylyltransferase [Candidatus Woesearchaeota archaeon]|nr:glucose-1-phosphate adenylyltransferase [Candidatus Woesearchaeota archaeon]